MVNFAAATSSDGQKLLDIYGETIQHRPCGELSDEEDITAIFDEDTLGGRELEQVEDDRGKRIRHVAFIEVLPDTVDHKSHVVKDDKVWKVVRPEGKDAVLETWRIERTEKISTRPRGGMS